MIQRGNDVGKGGQGGGVGEVVCLGQGIVSCACLSVLSDVWCITVSVKYRDEEGCSFSLICYSVFHFACSFCKLAHTNSLCREMLACGHLSTYM